MNERKRVLKETEGGGGAGETKKTLSAAGRSRKFG
jgi:hypothetical protein